MAIYFENKELTHLPPQEDGSSNGNCEVHSNWRGHASGLHSTVCRQSADPVHQPAPEQRCSPAASARRSVHRVSALCPGAVPRRLRSHRQLRRWWSRVYPAGTFVLGRRLRTDLGLRCTRIRRHNESDHHRSVEEAAIKAKC